jgi:hypothetical protein
MIRSAQASMAGWRRGMVLMPEKVASAVTSAVSIKIATMA